MIVAYVVIGAVLTWILQTSPLFDFVRRNRLGMELLSCTFCTGCWVFTFISALVPTVVWEALLSMPYIPILTNLLVGIITSLSWYYAKEGWEATHNAVQS